MLVAIKSWEISNYIFLLLASSGIIEKLEFQHLGDLSTSVDVPASI